MGAHLLTLEHVRHSASARRKSPLCGLRPPSSIRGNLLLLLLLPRLRASLLAGLDEGRELVEVAELLAETRGSKRRLLGVEVAAVAAIGRLLLLLLQLARRPRVAERRVDGGGGGGGGSGSGRGAAAAGRRAAACSRSASKAKLKLLAQVDVVAEALWKWQVGGQGERVQVLAERRRPASNQNATLPGQTLLNLKLDSGYQLVFWVAILEGAHCSSGSHLLDGVGERGWRAVELVRAAPTRAPAPLVNQTPAQTLDGQLGAGGLAGPPLATGDAYWDQEARLCALARLLGFVARRLPLACLPLAILALFCLRALRGCRHCLQLAPGAPMKATCSSSLYLSN